MRNQVLSSKFNVYGAITEKIARSIREQKGRFVMPWHAADRPLSLPTNAATNRSYHGANILSLWIDSLQKGFRTAYWASYRQWQTLGAQVRYGERGSLVIFFKTIEATDEDGEGAPRFVGRASWVFNADQIDDWVPPASEQAPAFGIDESVATFVVAVGARIEHGYQMARYRRDLDSIEMPSLAWFFDAATRTAAQAYHAVLFHELTHWTGPSHRCDREFGKRFGDRAYAFEELVAELGAAFLCSAFHIVNEPRPDHAAYMADWLTILGNDPKAIFAAAHKAQEAIEYMGELASAKVEQLSQ